MSPPAHPDTADPASPLPRPVRVGNEFRNPGHHRDRTWLEVMRWKLLGPRPAPWPAPLRPPVHAPAPCPPAPAAGIAATWIGHASFLLRTPRLALLVDPVWSERIGPVPGFGPRRAVAPGVSIDSLPPLDAVLLSHDHYDHCDLPTLRRLAREHPRARLLAPLGFESLARRAGFGPERTRLFDWWESAALPASDGGRPEGDRMGASGLVVTATPARHWCNRLSGGRNRRLWCGWHLAETPSAGASRDADASLLFAGDTAFDAGMFAAIRRRLGAPDLALLPIGAYAPRWFMCEQHCDPEEALRLHLTLGARRGVGMHWGVFRLTDEPREEPPARLAAALRAAGLPPEAFVTVEPGETVGTGTSR